MADVPGKFPAFEDMWEKYPELGQSDLIKTVCVYRLRYLRVWELVLSSSSSSSSEIHRVPQVFCTSFLHHVHPIYTSSD